MQPWLRSRPIDPPLPARPGLHNQLVAPQTSVRESRVGLHRPASISAPSSPGPTVRRALQCTVVATDGEQAQGPSLAFDRRLTLPPGRLVRHDAGGSSVPPSQTRTRQIREGIMRVLRERILVARPHVNKSLVRILRARAAIFSLRVYGSSITDPRFKLLWSMPSSLVRPRPSSSLRYLRDHLALQASRRREWLHRKQPDV